MLAVTHHEKVVLEQLIDNAGLAAVVDALAGICHDKSEHVTQSYGDNITASVWRLAEQRLDRAATTFSRDNL